MRRHFDWEILPAASGQSLEAVFRALARVVDWVLVTADAARFQFCHVPAREAVLMFAAARRSRGGRANTAGARLPKIRKNRPKKRNASGMLMTGGMTSRRASLG